jgi:hypothetical protein
MDQGAGTVYEGLFQPGRGRGKLAVSSDGKGERGEELVSWLPAQIPGCGRWELRG